MIKFESSIKTIPHSQESVYNKLSDLNNLEQIKNKIPSDKASGLSFDSDMLHINIPPAGNLSLKIVEREPYKCIKFETVTSPLPFHLWIQLLPLSETECKMKLTLELDANPIMKAMLQKPLQDGIEKMADVIAMLEY